SLCCLLLPHPAAYAWQFFANGTANNDDVGYAIAVDAAGDAVAAGYLYNDSTDFFVVKLSGESGAELWRVVIDGAAHDSDEAVAVAVNSVGDVIVGGPLTGFRGQDIAVLKLAGDTGTELWRRTIDGPFGGNDGVSSLALDSHDDIVVAGGL